MTKKENNLQVALLQMNWLILFSLFPGSHNMDYRNWLHWLTAKPYLCIGISPGTLLFDIIFFPIYHS